MTAKTVASHRCLQIHAIRASVPSGFFAPARKIHGARASHPNIAIVARSNAKLYAIGLESGALIQFCVPNNTEATAAHSAAKRQLTLGVIVSLIGIHIEGGARRDNTRAERRCRPVFGEWWDRGDERQQTRGEPIRCDVASPCLPSPTPCVAM